MSFRLTNESNNLMWKEYFDYINFVQLMYSFAFSSYIPLRKGHWQLESFGRSERS